MVKTRVISLRVIENPKAHYQSAFCAFYAFLVGSPNECWLHLCDACLITTWTLGLRAPLFARKNKDYRGTLYTGKKDNKVDFTENRTTRRICINI